jgi:hypothetical protein
MHPQYTAQIESIVMKLPPNILIFQSETQLAYITASIAELVSTNGKLLRKLKVRNDKGRLRNPTIHRRSNAEGSCFLSCNPAQASDAVDSHQY